MGGMREVDRPAHLSLKNPRKLSHQLLTMLVKLTPVLWG